jgi:uncharacterized protein YndB with AHSA1/START domain
MTELEITRTVHILASRAAVWAALTEDELVSEWFGDETQIDFRVGGTGFLRWDDWGSFRLVVEEIDAQNSLAIRWAREVDVDPIATNSTVFRFTLADREHGIDLTVVETGWESLDGDIQAAMRSNTEGWTAELDELVAFLEKQDSQ